MPDPAEVNYANIEIPEDKDKEEWTPTERRAYVLEKIKSHGGPYAIQTDKIADEFDVTTRTIQYDRSKIVESWANDNEQIYSQIMMDTLMDIKALKKEGKYDKAVRAKMKWLKMAEKLGEIDVQPDKVEVEHEETPTYNINVNTTEDDDIDEDEKIDSVDN